MIHIFLRETANNKFNNDRPEWFNYERCFKSLIDSIHPNDAKLTIIFDGKIPENHYINKYNNKLWYNYNVVNINAGNDFISNTKTFEYINALDYIKKDDIIGVFENDYLYLNDWVKNVLWLYNHNINFNIFNTYITLFDHADKYLFNNLEATNEWGMYKDLKSQIYIGLNRYWRNVPNTCGSFILSKQLFDKDYDIHTNGTADNTRFYELTTKRNRIVLSPMPGLATHCNKYFLSPFINWKEINDKIQIL